MKKQMNYLLLILASGLTINSCGKKTTDPTPAPQPPSALIISSATINGNGLIQNLIYYGANLNPIIKVLLNNSVDKSTVANAVLLSENGTTNFPINISYENNDSTIIISPQSSLKSLTNYQLNFATSLQSLKGGKLNANGTFSFNSQIDSTDKFPQISDNALLDTIQKRTFKYFWDYGHPVSGLARERSNNSPETVTSGGSGFGIMSIPVGVSRNFITRTQGLQRMQTIVSFLKNTAQKFHGAFPHWLNGTSGVVIPFSPKDDGADLVETSYLMQGLLTARQFFNGTDANETALRNDINILWNGVEWNWFRQNNQNVLYWHWSPNYAWQMNFPIHGWNECLITYMMASCSNTDSIPPIVYQTGFAQNGAEKNGNTYYGYNLPLGPANGGPLFWSHYSFLGMNPNGLTDAYANYQTQTTNHTKINYEYCKANPKNYFGYSNICWGLTASDIPNGYSANEPNNDIGVISPTAAISSLPYTPTESMNAIRFFYYKLGDKIFKDYGFVDAFSLKDLWYANSFLAIDQGPEMVMIENYRSQLIWNLFTSCPEVKRGMKRLGFSAPYL